MLKAKIEIVNIIEKAGLVPVFFNRNTTKSIKVFEVFAQAGGRVFELTNRGVEAKDVFDALIKHKRENNIGVTLGVGSILNADDASHYIACGAEFVVGPVYDDGVQNVCDKNDVLYIPGCATPTEMHNAVSRGARIVKAFPIYELGGADFVKAVLAPMRHLKIMGAGGVEADEESLRAYFRAGVTCVSVGSNLFDKKMIENDEWGALNDKVEHTLAIVRDIQAGIS